MDHLSTAPKSDVIQEFKRLCDTLGPHQAALTLRAYIHKHCIENADLVVALYQEIIDFLDPAERITSTIDLAWFSLHQSRPDYLLHRRSVDLWWQIHGQTWVEAVKPAPRPRRSRRDGRLRVGFAGGDWSETNHYTQTVFRPTIEALPRDLFAVHLYADGLAPIDDSIAQMVEVARPAGNLDSAIWDIAADDLDVLFWPLGFVAHAPFRMMRARPARRIALWMHTYSTFGPELVDASLQDIGLMTPVHEQIQYEAVIKTNGPAVLFGVSSSAPPVTSAPRTRSRGIVFGTFNRASKITFDMVQAWKKILDSVPGSRLMIANQSYRYAPLRAHVARLLDAAGIDSDRVELPSFQASTRDFLDLYSQVDIALDTSPFNGGVSTLDALWQGVPVVTLAQPEPNACIGQYMLSKVGRSDLVTTNHAEYVARAIALANDPADLDAWRRDARERVRTSPLMAPGDIGERMARAVEDLLQCQTGPERAQALGGASAR